MKLVPKQKTCKTRTEKLPSAVAILWSFFASLSFFKEAVNFFPSNSTQSPATTESVVVETLLITSLRLLRNRQHKGAGLRA